MQVNICHNGEKVGEKFEIPQEVIEKMAAENLVLTPVWVWTDTGLKLIRLDLVKRR